MKLRDTHEHLLNLSDSQLLNQVEYATLLNLNFEIAKWYDKKLNLPKILSGYGIEDMDWSAEEQQVNCLLLEHGGRDSNKSARYFAFDRETGKREASVYCYKCCKRLTPFWYLYRYEKDYHNLNLKKVYSLINLRFGIPFPQDLILDFDPELFYTFDQVTKSDKLMGQVQQALSVRSLKTQGFSDLYLEAVRGFIAKR